MNKNRDHITVSLSAAGKARIITPYKADIPLILLDSVELVVWRRPDPPGLDAALKDFNPGTLDPQRINDPDRRRIYIDADRVFIDEADAPDHPVLRPVWEERKGLRAVFARALACEVDMTHLFAQGAVRPEQRDFTFHRDYCTGYKGDEEKRRRGETVFFTVVHAGEGTESIPAADAGRPTPYTKDKRACFYRPKSLQNLFRARTHDVMVMKSGKGGTVHRSPHEGQGLRWWTFYAAGQPLTDLSLARGARGMEQLQDRYAALTAHLQEGPG
ncbi:MAG: hypothetical protein H6867_02885 [Rhodospirillales bacterium]|nr:hypothetical protein [Rhodospirillales bacterium]MCB9996096.1 hypothetical protein [Rhodospirillales bacterium]